MGVIDFKKEKLNLILKKPEKYCNCVRVLINRHERELYCQDCDRVLDPFDFMVSAAEKDYNFYYRTKERYKEYENLNKTIKKLKNEERNIKARIRRLNKLI